MNSLLLCSNFKKWIVLFIAVSMSIFNIPISSVADSADQKESDPVFDQEESEEEDTETETQSESIDGMTMLYIGGAVAGVAALAISLGSSSGSSGPGTPPPELTPPPSEPTPPSSDPDPDPEPEPEPDPPSLPDPPSDPSTNPPVGPDLNGSDWTGFLDIKDVRHRGYQSISASIIHSGSSVQIKTSSTLDYGRQFNGTISSSGYMLMYDSISGEDWTTYKGNASTNRVPLYDFVNGFKDLDVMKLSR